MMAEQKGYNGNISAPKEPRKRMGVFKTLDDVPDQYRLATSQARFEGSDPWERWYAETKDHSERTRHDYERAKRLWVEHMEEKGRHYALARPSDVEEWLTEVDNSSARRLYNACYCPLDGFYSWLATHAEYPHVYNPVMMAVVEGGTARRAYDYRTTKAVEKTLKQERAD